MASQTPVTKIWMPQRLARAAESASYSKLRPSAKGLDKPLAFMSKTLLRVSEVSLTLPNTLHPCSCAQSAALLRCNGFACL